LKAFWGYVGVLKLQKEFRGQWSASDFPAEDFRRAGSDWLAYEANKDGCEIWRRDLQSESQHAGRCFLAISSGSALVFYAEDIKEVEKKVEQRSRRDLLRGTAIGRIRSAVMRFGCSAGIVKKLWEAKP